MLLSCGSMNLPITMETSAVPPLSSLRLIVKINMARKRGRVSEAKPFVSTDWLRLHGQVQQQQIKIPEALNLHTAVVFVSRVHTV